MPNLPNIQGIAGLFVPRFQSRSIIACAALLFVLWLPYAIVLFPGTMNWDTYYQMYQCFPENGPAINVAAPSQPIFTQFHDHHPVMLSLFYGMFAVVSQRLFGTWTWGCYALMMLQVVAFAVTLSFASCYLERLKAPAWFRVLSLVFFGLCPVVAIYNCTIIKDVTFSLLFVWWFIIVLEILRSKGSALGCRWLFVCFLVLCVIMPLTKKTGLYILAPSVFLMAFACRAQWKKLVACALLPVLVLQLVMPYIVFPVLSVTPGGEQEALNTIFQQTARYVVVHGDSIEEADREAIDRVLDYDTLADRYDPHDTNPVKDGYNYDSTRQDLLEYFKVWTKQGLSDPGLYLESVWLTVDGYFVPYRPMKAHVEPTSVGNGGGGEIINPGLLKPAKQWIGAAYEKLSYIPVIGWFTRIAVYNWIIPAIAFVAACFSRDRRWCLIAFAPIALTIASSVFSFESYVGRYVIHSMYVAPLLLGIGFFSSFENRDDSM